MRISGWRVHSVAAIRGTLDCLDPALTLEVTFAEPYDHSYYALVDEPIFDQSGLATVSIRL